MRHRNSNLNLNPFSGLADTRGTKTATD